MILSKSHKFIYLHARKTAGSSVSSALASTLAHDDIMIGCWPDALTSGVSYNRQAIIAANNLRYTKLKLRLNNLFRTGSIDITPGQINWLIKQYYAKNYNLNSGTHSTAAEIKDLCGEGLWGHCFKFAFTRNPWDHAVSDYFWRKADLVDLSFQNFLKILSDPTIPDPNLVRPPLISNWDIYSINDEIVLDFIGRFEFLEDHLKIVEKKTRISILGNLPRRKIRPAEKKIELSTFYNDETIELVRSIYRKEIDAFNYTIPF